jgi:8-oxo-dGTP pyrophosphatase MutT (NUDIX family)
VNLARVRKALRVAPPTPVLFDGFPDSGVSAAVLVALFEEAGEARVVLTRRAAHLRVHQGEVSFPGGRIDPGEDARSAALREAAEEVGIRPGSVEIVGELTALGTWSSKATITPLVGILEARPELSPNPQEVERAFDVALADLLVPGVYREERWHIPGRRVPGSPDSSFPVWFFELPGDTVWGATARILVELLSVVLEE